MPTFYMVRRIVRDHRRDVLLNRERSTEGNTISTGPYDDPAAAFIFAIAAMHDPPRDAGSMDFENIEFVQSEERPAPSFDQLREALRSEGVTQKGY